jgi:hypothetical protein
MAKVQQILISFTPEERNVLSVLLSEMTTKEITDVLMRYGESANTADEQAEVIQAISAAI